MSQYIKQILAALIGIGLIILIIVLIVRGFSSTGVPSKSIDLVTFAKTNATAVLYVDGPINDDSDHRTIKIFVDRNQVGIDIIQGYQGNVIDGRRYTNNQQGYAVFLQALAHLNFTKGSSSAKLQDERGYCPTGNRFIYQFLASGSSSFRYWSTSCGQGSFGGTSNPVHDLFYSQIPEQDFNQLSGDIPH